MSSDSRSSAKTAPIIYTCPHLGMLDDTTTTTTFPSEANHCLHCRHACVPSRQHQLHYCLSQNYTNCAIIDQPSPARLPASRRWKREQAEFKTIFVKTALAVFASGLLAMFFILGAPARISRMIQAFVPDTTREVYQPVSFATRTPTADARVPFATSTSFVSQIEIPSAIPIPQIVKLTVVELEMGAYCRVGPDISFASVTILKTGNILQALARDSSDRYYLVRVTKQAVDDCWIEKIFVKAQGDPASLPVYTPMPTPWPTRTFTPEPPTPTNTALSAPRLQPTSQPPTKKPPTLPTLPPAQTTEPPTETTEPPTETPEPPTETTEPPG